MKLPRPPLLVITDRHQARASLADVLAAAFAAGCRWASIREKDLTADEQVALARALLPLAARHGARLTLHGEPDIVLAAGVDGVHLPAGADAAAARRRMGRQALVGISIHTSEEAGRLDPGVLDYAIAGPAYASASKPGHGPALGLAGVAAIAALGTVPIVAIGGITLGVVAEMRTAGAAGIAVMGSVMRADNPAQQVRALIAALDPRS